ncbi:nucleotidyltransferase family protein [Fibrella sp. WM1]|uniref:nucleotidyltransferase family protein n=1 Tax=Fibrella musci TaxID=3242485 RepID=UPI00351FEC87
MDNDIQINFIINAIRCIYSENEYVPIGRDDIEKLDWIEVRRLAAFHRIRPTLVTVLTKLNAINSPDSQPLFDFYKYQTFKNLLFVAESVRLLDLFRQHTIPVLPYKGHLFIHEFYSKQTSREVDDIDFLFLQHSVRAAIRLLQLDGYRLRVKDGPISSEEEIIRLDNMLNSSGKYELSMEKGKLIIDVHWQLNYTFLPYQVDYNELFSRSVEKPFYTTICNVPDAETMFWMLVLHHGGKEFWLRLKHLVDLMAFMNEYEHQLDWESILIKAKQYKLFTAMMTGFSLVKTHFATELPHAVNKALTTFRPLNNKRIERYWTYAQHWINARPMLMYERICITNQDEGFSKRRYLQQFIREYSSPNPVGRRRMITIPERFLYLNFVYKLLSFLRRRF